MEAAATFAQGAAAETGLVDAAKPKARGESTAGAAVVAAGCVVIKLAQFIVSVRSMISRI